jgi:hypothetical protein
MDDYISDLAEINQSSEYLVKNLGNFSKINNEVDTEIYRHNEVIKKKICVLLKLKILLIKLSSITIVRHQEISDRLL